MDTSETYINMCWKAWGALKNNIQVDTHDFSYFIREDDKDKHFILFRQDQLQEMIEGTHMEKLGRVYRAVVKMELYPSETMEQLWLVFIMEEKFNKIWDGKDWVEEKT